MISEVTLCRDSEKLVYGPRASDVFTHAQPDSQTLKTHQGSISLVSVSSPTLGLVGTQLIQGHFSDSVLQRMFH